MLERFGQRQQRAFVADPADQLHADRQGAGGHRQRQRQRRVAGHVGVGGEIGLVGRHRRAEGKGALRRGRHRQHVALRQPLLQLHLGLVHQLRSGGISCVEVVQTEW